MDFDLERLGRSLVLKEDEVGGVALSEDVWRGDNVKEGYLLVGRLLTPCPYRYDVLRMTLTTILHPIKRLTVTVLTDNRFLLQFEHPSDRNKALERCPWTFDRNLVILNKVTAVDNPLDVDLNWCPFFVHIHGLPLRMMTKKVSEVIGNRIGIFLELDHAHMRGSWNSKNTSSCGSGCS
ncbi:UNVERIFIED_CONTAM: hypothetical protein Sradi_1775000 [Sesamum radiatum]|uniref:DUF4283 domain-containing protein n=1 Tax=Sesamum radiatum TaxID=300843 RepID=A0AAW2TY23_SESRA